MYLPHNPEFKQPQNRILLKTLWEQEKMLVTSIFSFSHNVSYPSQNKFQISAKFDLLSANASNLDQSKYFSFGKELTLYDTIPRLNDPEKEGHSV